MQRTIKVRSRGRGRRKEIEREREKGDAAGTRADRVFDRVEYRTSFPSVSYRIFHELSNRLSPSVITAFTPRPLLEAIAMGDRRTEARERGSKTAPRIDDLIFTLVHSSIAISFPCDEV